LEVAVRAAVNEYLKSKTIKLLLLAIESVAFFLFIKGDYVLSGCIVMAAGVVGVILGLFCFELMVLIGLMIISAGFQQKLLSIITSVLLVIVGVYDFIQLLLIDKQFSRTEWLDRFQKRELLHWLVNRLRRQSRK
jgi:hypothetical protein